MTTWEESGWFPPTDPPVAGGLPLDDAQAIADRWWDIDPYYAAGLAWQHYAAQLVASGDPGGGVSSTGAVSAVSTGVQSVSYATPVVLDAYGLAERKAAWFFSHSAHGAGGLASIELTTTMRVPDPASEWPIDWWQRDLEHP